MRRHSRALFMLAAFSLLITAACSHDSSNDTNKSLAKMGLSLQSASIEPIAVVANPATIVIDTTNPSTPTDPNSGKFLGTSAIQATLKDAEGIVRPGVEVIFSTDFGTLASAGAPVVTSDQGVAGDVLTVNQDAPETVNVRATAGEESASVGVKVTVVLPNQPPVANAGADQTIECSSPSGTPVALNGSGSTDLDSTPGTNDDITSYEWMVNGAVVASTMTATVALSPGTTIVTLRVTDKQGATATDEVVITIVDTIPPVLRVSPQPDSLWPPNHKMHDINARVEVVDACTPPSAMTVRLISVSSDEPDNGLGDGDTENDISGASPGTDDRSLQLRAERSGPGDGRTYTLVYSVTDAAGLSTEGSGYVRVPHDQGH